MSEEDVQEEPIDWSDFGEPKDKDDVKLEKLDYLAIFIASLQTTFLPFILMMIVLLMIGMLFGIFL